MPHWLCGRAPFSRTSLHSSQPWPLCGLLLSHPISFERPAGVNAPWTMRRLHPISRFSTPRSLWKSRFSRGEPAHRALGGGGHRHEQMVVLDRGDDIAADPAVGERSRNGGGEADRFEVGVDGQRDPGGPETRLQAARQRRVLLENYGPSFRFAERRDRRNPVKSASSGTGSRRKCRAGGGASESGEGRHD